MTHMVRLDPPAPPDAAAALVCVTDPDILRGHLQDVSRMTGFAERLYRPQSEEALSALLARLDAERIPVTLVARQTSTTGASVPEGGAIVMLDNMLGTLEVDRERLRASAGAGMLLGAFQQALEEEGLLYPPDPTSRNECTLGGSVACNASGARTFRYGPTRAWVEGLRVVLADGHRLRVSRGEVRAKDGRFVLAYPDGRQVLVPCPTYAMPGVKHAAGYHSSASDEDGLDLVDMFIGSEGTLGGVTWVDVRVIPLPERVLSFLTCFPDTTRALSCVKQARAFRQGSPTCAGASSFPLTPRCIEWLDAQALEIIRHRFPEANLPAAAQAALFFEQECSLAQEDAALDAWWTFLTDSGALSDDPGGILLADSEARLALLYSMRHAVPAGVNEQAARNGMPKLGTDLAVPDDSLDAIMALYASGVEDIPGALPPVRCLEVLSEVAAISGDMGSTHALVELEMQVGRGEPVPDFDATLRKLWDVLDVPRRLDSATFGHIGDNHVHVNLLPKTQAGLIAARALYAEWTRVAIRLGGTVSAEHGIGKIKRKALGWLLTDEGIQQMRAVKEAFDPGWCLGRGTLMEFTGKNGADRQDTGKRGLMQ